MLKGYWIARVDVHDPEGYKAYLAANASALKKYGGKFLVRGGKFDNPEGGARARNVVLEFPSYQVGARLLVLARIPSRDPAPHAVLGRRLPDHRRLRRPATLTATFAIKTEIRDPRAKTFTFTAQKTMYGGKTIAAGDTIYLFASENEGGQGLIARGIITAAEAVAKKPGPERQTPRVSITIKRTALAKRALGRSELKPFATWNDGKPATELNFKFYRQATNKIVGISDKAAAFLGKYF